MGMGSVAALVFFVQNVGAFTGHVARGPSPRHFITATSTAGAHHIRSNNLRQSQVALLLSSATDAQESTDTLSGSGEPLTQQVRVRTGERREDDRETCFIVLSRRCLLS